ncbi:unnamed protein product [Somion occarium]|uniref:Glycosyltransferase family 8 protein n=1 Tax=Somion occarium TaxID=3059160 RepID=A0ABP1DUL7_9APHY
MPLFHTRRREYVPLATSPTSAEPLKRPKRRYLFLAAFLLLIITSFAFNVFFLVRAHTRNWTNPLDNYQGLNHQPLLDVSVSTRVSNTSAHAVVTTLYDDTFAPAVATLGHSLQQVNTSARLIVLYLPSQVSPRALCIATASGFEPHPVERIAPPHDGQGVYIHFLDQFTKLRLWTLDQVGIQSLVYLDADTLVKKNFDELFGLPFNFAAVPDVFYNYRGYTLAFNAGMLFVRPSSALFTRMLKQLPYARFPPVDAEQSFLNHYFGIEAVRLPYAYNANLAIKRRTPEVWQGGWDEFRVVHFTLVKPFLGKRYAAVRWDDLEAHVRKVAGWEGGRFRNETMWWGETFKGMKKVRERELSRCWMLDEKIGTRT